MPLRWRTLDKQSVQAWSELANLLAEVDDTEEFHTPENLAEELDEPSLDPALDTWAVWEGTDRLVGFGQLRIRDGLNEGRAYAHLGGGVHPEFRGQGIGGRLLDLMQERARERSAQRHPGIAVTMNVDGGLEGDPVRRLLERRGFSIVRYYHSMRRPYPGPQLEEPMAAVEPYRPEFNRALHRAHNDAFATHFAFAPASEVEWDHRMESRTFRPEATYVVRGDDGAIKAYVMSYCYVDKELYVGRVGTVQAERRKGYARSCLLAVLRAGLDQGYTQADLDVDSSNPTGAGALYESAGFIRRKTYASYDKVFDVLR
ncbi:MAG: mycothiol synthase [Pseudonocardiales bacterium]|jgi:ribosomal protein S18 acetylase RimI-like enzyme|nr:mycothiol synthase [Pseudonocardiales bacterium]